MENLIFSKKNLDSNSDGSQLSGTLSCSISRWPGTNSISEDLHKVLQMDANFLTNVFCFFLDYSNRCRRWNPKILEHISYCQNFSKIFLCFLKVNECKLYYFSVVFVLIISPLFIFSDSSSWYWYILHGADPHTLR